MADMTDISDSGSVIQTYDPITLIDEVSSTEYYIGVSNNGNSQSRPVWSIKKIKKTGNVWNITLFPNGLQTSTFVWNNRAIYTYI